MSISNADIQKAIRIRKSVSDFFEKSPETKILAKDLMQKFIKDGIFLKDDKEGLPIRSFLRLLLDNNHLHLVSQAWPEPKIKNNNWYFLKTNK